MAKSLFNDSKPVVSKRRASRISFKDHPSLTRQSPKAGCAIDAILKMYATKGVSPTDVGVFMTQAAQAPYGVQPSTDYQMMLNEVIRVQDYFDSLPSRVRERFRHDPKNMVDFLADPKNHEEAAKLGLVERKPEESSSKAGATTAAVTTAPAAAASPAVPASKASAS